MTGFSSSSTTLYKTGGTITPSATVANATSCSFSSNKVITAWHDCHFSNGPTEAMNNLIKRVKRVAFGFTSFRNYRIRSLLYAGKPDWSLLGSITPH